MAEERSISPKCIIIGDGKPVEPGRVCVHFSEGDQVVRVTLKDEDWAFIASNIADYRSKEQALKVAP